MIRLHDYQGKRAVIVFVLGKFKQSSKKNSAGSSANRS